MGVMSCHRNNCTNIMCDTYIDEVGYICTSCQSEFQEEIPHELPKSDMIDKLKEFMETEKKYYSPKDIEPITASTLFSQNTK